MLKFQINIKKKQKHGGYDVTTKVDGDVGAKDLVV